MQDCSNSIANALELLQSCTKPFLHSLMMHTAHLNEYTHDLCFVVFRCDLIQNSLLAFNVTWLEYVFQPSEARHDDVIKWNHLPRYWPFVKGIHRSKVDSPCKGQWRSVLIFSLICAWTNGWANNGDAIGLIMKSLWWAQTPAALLARRI